jgi:hypothetical protein
MQVCPNCANRNRPGVIFCENCGASLIGDAPISTRSIGPKGPNDTAPEISFTHITDSAATDVFPKDGALKIEITGAEPILLKTKPEIVFGRRDPATGAMPDVDLTPFAGYRMGVSRRHAAIRRSGETALELWDLGSSNGTFVNGARLLPHKAHRLRDGDELKLGQMTMKVYFQVPTLPAVPPPISQEVTRPKRPSSSTLERHLASQPLTQPPPAQSVPPAPPAPAQPPAQAAPPSPAAAPPPAPPAPTSPLAAPGQPAEPPPAPPAQPAVQSAPPSPPEQPPAQPPPQPPAQPAAPPPAPPAPPPKADDSPGNSDSRQS